MASTALGGLGSKRYRTFSYRAAQSNRATRIRKRRRLKAALGTLITAFSCTGFKLHDCKETVLLKELQKIVSVHRFKVHRSGLPLFIGSYVWATLFSAAYTQHPYTAQFLFGLPQCR